MADVALGHPVVAGVPSGAHPQSGPASATSTVSMLVVRGLVGAVERAGSERVELLRAAGLDPGQLEPGDGRLPLRDVYRICGAALDLTGDPALGLHWAERWTGTAFVPVSYLIAHSRSLRHAFESLSRYGTLLSDEPGYELLERGSSVTLRCSTPADEPLRVRRFIAEMVVASFFRILRARNAPGQPERVSFEYAAPAYGEEYARVFDGAARFEQPFTGLVFDRALLDSAQPNQDEGIHEAMRTLAERRVSRLAQQVPYALRVRELLIERGWPGRVDMQAVARALGLSVRSLRRRLASEGKAYAQLEHDAFTIVATRLLRDQRRTIQEAAYEMGFSDTSTFHRAFKRATGTTPSKYRQSQRE
jgi:AraC-like DNA-binding protein